MSALGLASLGIHCRNKALGQASLGVFCGVGIKGGGSDEEIRKNHLASIKRQKDKKKIQEYFPEDLSQVIEEVVETGKAEVNGIEVIVGNPIKKPTPTIQASAPTLEDISNSLDREIAELIRVSEHLRYKQLLKKYEEDVARFEEEFLLFLMLMMED